MNFSFPFTSLPKAGDRQISQTIFEEFARRIAKLSALNADGLEVMVEGSGVDLIAPSFPEVFVAKLGEESEDFPGWYAWKRQRIAATETGFEDVPDGLAGTTEVNAATAFDDAAALPAGTLVIMFPGFHSLTDDDPPEIDRGWRFIYVTPPMEFIEYVEDGDTIEIGGDEFSEGIVKVWDKSAKVYVDGPTCWAREY